MAQKKAPQKAATQTLQHRIFKVVREEDPANVTGTGEIAEGVEWSDGTVTVKFRHGEISTYSSMRLFSTVHGARGLTHVELL